MNKNERESLKRLTEDLRGDINRIKSKMSEVCTEDEYCNTYEKFSTREKQIWEKIKRFFSYSLNYCKGDSWISTADLEKRIKKGEILVFQTLLPSTKECLQHLDV